DFESISISGHKFFGIDSPCGLFITTRDVYDNQTTYDIPYLNADMRMINCSRSGIEPLKFWWLIQTVGDKGWTEQATRIMENTRYLKEQLTAIGVRCWNNTYSNTVFFTRPSEAIVRKYNLANSHDNRFGGNLSHIVVMQHVTKEAIDGFITAMKAEQNNR
ncbi:MAG: pyridoxal-dependent decarboxylase, partial [Prevotella sp.]